MDAVRHYPIERHRMAAVSSVLDAVVVEEPLEIRLAHAQFGAEAQTLSLTMRTPGQDAELAIGYLYCEGVIRSRAQVEAVVLMSASAGAALRVQLVGPAPDLGPLQRVGTLSSSCGLCGKRSVDALSASLPEHTVKGAGTVDAKLLRQLPARLRAAQPVFAVTGGLHGVGLFDLDGQLLALREDVGRHNALDKLIGQALLKDDLPWTDRVLLLSGRASFELLQKATMAGASIVAAVGAPSSLAIEQARRAGITLIGFLGENGYNIYTGGERVQAVLR